MLKEGRLGGWLTGGRSPKVGSFVWGSTHNLVVSSEFAGHLERRFASLSSRRVVIDNAEKLSSRIALYEVLPSAVVEPLPQSTFKVNGPCSLCGLTTHVLLGAEEKTYSLDDGTIPRSSERGLFVKERDVVGKGVFVVHDVVYVTWEFRELVESVSATNIRFLEAGIAVS